MIKKKEKAFTIVELLTVISIIAMIIGLLVPGLNKARIIAKDMKQKAQFHAIVTGLEMFKTENENYPDSSESTQVSAGRVITGAHKLAEALVGRDLQGYDPVTNINNPEDFTNAPYGLTAKTTINQTKLVESLDRRKGPYLSLDNLAAVDTYELYTNPTATGNVYAGAAAGAGTAAPVLTDIYMAKRVTVTLANGSTKSISAGTPILYYRANIVNKFNNSTSPATIANSTYNIYDNDELVLLGSVKDATKHKIDSSYTDPVTSKNGIAVFYDMIANNNASANLATGLSRPYKTDSYILISAGYDGIYGTSDDITNFEE